MKFVLALMTLIGFVQTASAQSENLEQIISRLSKNSNYLTDTNCKITNIATTGHSLSFDVTGYDFEASMQPGFATYIAPSKTTQTIHVQLNLDGTDKSGTQEEKILLRNTVASQFYSDSDESFRFLEFSPSNKRQNVSRAYISTKNPAKAALDLEGDDGHVITGQRCYFGISMRGPIHHETMAPTDTEGAK